MASDHSAMSSIEFQLAIEAGRIGTWRRDLSSNLIHQSAITSSILGHGHTATVIPFDYLFTYTHPQDLHKFGDSLAPLIESGEPFDVEFRIWHPEGTLRWIAVRGKSLKDDSGKPREVVGVMFDITDRKQAAERFRLLTEYNPDAVVVEVNRRIVYANPCATHLLGLSEPLEVSRPSFLSFATSDSRGTVLEAYHRISEEAPASGLRDLGIMQADGTVAHVQAMFGFLFWDGQAATQIIMRDVTALKETQDQVQHLRDRLALIVEGTGEGIWEWDIVNKVFNFSGGFNKIIGRDEAEHLPHPEGWDSIIHPEDAARVQMSFQEALREKVPLYGIEFRIRTNDGRWKWVRSRGVIVEEDQAGQPLVMAGTLVDITVQKASDELSWRHTHLDTLTSLPNRRLLMQCLDYEARKTLHADRQLALLFIDLDGFKSVNDLYGHDTGDGLLIEAARRIKECLDDCGTVARVGGDEFVAILPGLSRLEDVELHCQSVLRSLSLPFDLAGNPTYLSASIGISVLPLDADTPEDLLRKAEQAMHIAKKRKNRFTYFTAELDERALDRWRLANALRVALSEDQLRLHYQPIVELNRQRVVKAEALLRWEHPSLGKISPAAFIPLAEELGLIIPIGEWTCRNAIDFCKRCESTFGLGFQIGINMSPIQFTASGDECDIAGHLAAARLSGDRIVAEVTEGMLLNASPTVFERFAEFRRMGVQVALDDFGTGYSSMSYLQKFDIDYIKIDKSFIQNIAVSQDSRAIVETIIVMAHKLNKKVIAEGVETDQQLDFLMQAGCDYGQGFLFSPALPPEEFIGLSSVGL